MHYLITGHTGFKGAWLTELLIARGHRVSGLALDPAAGGIFALSDLDRALVDDHRVDVRDADSTRRAITGSKPDVVLHLAAQPLVLASYEDFRGTIDTNVLGTLNVLDAVAAAPSVRATVIVTTDKVYRNTGRTAPYAESDELGSGDPYSTSKAMADLLTQAWVAAAERSPVAIARAGNVIGGGDVSPNRLVVDLVRAFEAGESIRLRHPDATRPWQHVLDCLAGYLALVDALLAGSGDGAWNFGPDPEDVIPVRRIAEDAARMWGAERSWVGDGAPRPHEAELLALDSTKASSHLGWENRVHYPESLAWTLEWERRVRAGEAPRSVTGEQLSRFAALSAVPGAAQGAR